MPGVVSNKGMMWSSTPISKVPKGVTWSDDAIIRIPNSGQTDPDSTNYVRDVYDRSFTNFIAYVLYYHAADKMTYLEDIREGVTYAIPNGGKAKGYTLAFKLNFARKDK